MPLVFYLRRSSAPFARPYARPYARPTAKSVFLPMPPARRHGKTAPRYSLLACIHHLARSSHRRILAPSVDFPFILWSPTARPACSSSHRRWRPHLQQAASANTTAHTHTHTLTHSHTPTHRLHSRSLEFQTLSPSIHFRLTVRSPLQTCDLSLRSPLSSPCP